MFAEQVTARRHELDALDQLCRIERLDDEVVCASGNATLYIIDRFARRQECNRDMRAVRIAAHAAAGLKPVKLRHIHVKHYQLRLYPWKQRKAFLAAGGAENSIAGLAPNALHQGDHIGVVVDDEDDLRSHFFGKLLGSGETERVFDCSGLRSIHGWSSARCRGGSSSSAPRDALGEKWDHSVLKLITALD
jgi:hypothetical protein